MKKTKKTKKPSSSSSTSSDLKTLIHTHSLFFDSLVSLIPAKFYLAGAADDDERPYFNGLSKAAKASFKKQSRENTKKSRRDRFNPDKPSSTLDLLKNSLQNPQKPNPSSGSVTYEELRQRLRQRIDDLRSGRNTRPKPDPLKRKRENGDSPSSEPEDEEEEEEEVEPEAEEPKDISFGKVKIGDEERRRKKKKLTKSQELENAKKLAEMKKDPEKGGSVAWKAAASRAAGEKVHDDPRLIKESIKKERKRQQKNALKWKERVESRESAMKEKQKTRSDNIKERIQQKKARRIEKREKKLMRPGFEGRKEGYINK